MKKIFLLSLFAAIFLITNCKKQPTTTEPILPKGTPPSAPNFYQLVPFTQEPTRGMQLIIFDTSDNEDGFRIEKKTGGRFTLLTTLPANTETYDDWGPLATSTSYTYRIQAYNQYGNSAWSEKTQTSAGPDRGMVFFYATEDAYVDQAYPNDNYGDSGYLLVTGEYNSSKYKTSYIKFPIDEIPAYATDIEKAELRLISQNEQTSCSSVMVSVFELTSDWDENTVIWNNRPSVSFGATDTEYIYNDGQPVYFNITSILTKWHNGSIPNYGIELYDSYTSCLAILFSRERNQLKPLLTVDYYW